MTATDAAMDILSALVLESGERWGDAATPEQIADAAAIVDLDGGVPYHFLTRARGYSKTSDLAGIAAAVMLAQLPAGSNLYALASDRDQGRLITQAMAGFVARTPELRGSMTVTDYKATSSSQSTLEVLAADAAGAWGLRPSLVIVDELCQWQSTAKPRELWDAVTSAMAKVEGARMVVLTSAGDPAHWSRKVLDHAYADPMWRVHETPGPPPWADPARLAEQRRRLPEFMYQRLFENRWSASLDRLTSLEDLRQCVTLDGPQEPRSGRSYRIGVDLGLKHDRTACAVMHGERNGPDTVAVLDRLAVWQGTRGTPVDIGAVESWIVEAANKVQGARVIGDPWQATGMYQRLRAKHVPVEEFNFSAQSVGRLATTLYVAIRDHHLAIYDDEELIDELANVRLRETSPGVMRMDHDPDKHDDRAIALALAVQAIVGTGSSTVVRDWLEWICAEQQSESDTSAGTDAHPVGWRWAPQPDRPYLPETSAAVALLRNLGMRVQ